MIGVLDDFELLEVAVHPTAVFRRRRSLAACADRVVRSWFRRKDLLYKHIVHPVIPEVVDIPKPRFGLANYLGQPGLQGILALHLFSGRGKGRTVQLIT